MEKQEYIRHHLDAATRLWLRRAALGGSVLFLLLGLLDYVAAPEHFATFLVSGVALSAFLLTGYFAAGTMRQKHLYALGLVLITASALVIEMMILRSGGRESPYSVGMILLGISSLGFIPARFGFHLAVAFILYPVYLVPNLLAESAAGHRGFSLANFFTLLIFAAMLVMRYFSGKSLAEELGLKFDLERHRERLEEEVADRTTELAAAVENLQKEIAERKKAEEERRLLQDQFLQAQKMESIGRLAGGVAHDFNNILTAILSYAELSLMKLPDGHPLRSYLNVIKEASEKAAALTHRLLAFSRKQLLEMKVVNLNAVVRDMAKMLDRVIGEDIALELNLPDVRSVKADPTQIEQVLMNLAVNARDAMPDGGHLRIETADVDLDEVSIKAYNMPKQGSYVMLSVTDTGVGMSRDVREKIFEPFFTTKERGKGTGLGLATVYGIVKQHHGSILVESETGRGAIFRIYLPVAGERENTARKDAAEMPGGTEMVLLVEIDPALRALICEVLEGLGYRVLPASSGEEALATSAAFTNAIDLLLTGVLMPGIDGKQLAGRMRLRHPGLAVLFMAGHADDAVPPEELPGLGAALIHKPLTPATLAQKVRGALDDHAGQGRDPAQRQPCS